MSILDRSKNDICRKAREYHEAMPIVVNTSSQPFWCAGGQAGAKARDTGATGAQAGLWSHERSPKRWPAALCPGQPQLDLLSCVSLPCLMAGSCIIVLTIPVEFEPLACITFHSYNVKKFGFGQKRSKLSAAETCMAGMCCLTGCNWLPAWSRASCWRSSNFS